MSWNFALTISHWSLFLVHIQNHLHPELKDGCYTSLASDTSLAEKKAADALSRLPVDSAPDTAIKQTEEYACTIVADAIPAALAPRQVRENQSETLPCNWFAMP